MRPRLFVFALALLVFAACEAEPPRDSAGSIAEGGELSVFRFRVGDCFNDPSDEAETISEVEAVPCSQAHDNEVFHIFQLPEGPYPDSDTIDGHVNDECLPAFEDYVGLAYEQSDLYLFPITPTEVSWNDLDDREVVCALYLPDEQLVGSMRGASR